MVVSCHSVTPSRLKIVDFSVPFQRSSIVFVSRSINNVGWKFFLKILQNEVFWKCSIFLVLVTTFASIAITKGGFNVNKILKNWKTEKFNFKKITPKATKTLNIESIYDSHISTRI